MYHYQHYSFHLHFVSFGRIAAVDYYLRCSLVLSSFSLAVRNRLGKATFNPKQVHLDSIDEMFVKLGRRIH